MGANIINMSEWYLTNRNVLMFKHWLRENPTIDWPPEAVLRGIWKQVTDAPKWNGDKYISHHQRSKLSASRRKTKKR